MWQRKRAAVINQPPENFPNLQEIVDNGTFKGEFKVPGGGFKYQLVEDSFGLKLIGSGGSRFVDGSSVRFEVTKDGFAVLDKDAKGVFVVLNK